MKSLLAASLIAFIVPPASAASAYPTRPVRLIAPFAAGGGADTVARMIAQKLGDALSQQVVVDNRPGASNIIGTELAARAVPDGHTIMIANTVHTINAGLIRKLPYDPVNDFAPIGQIAATPFMLIVHPSVQASSVKDLIALAKSKPGQLNYASGGSGTAAHLAAEMFRMGAGIDITHVPYKGIPQGVIDTVAGATQMMIVSPLSALPQVKAGKVKLLAVTTTKRSAALPDVPTMEEAGVPGYAFSSWYGLLAPRGTPPAVIAPLNGILQKSLQQPDVRNRLSVEAAEPAGGTPAEFTELIAQEIRRFTDIAKRLELQVN